MTAAWRITVDRHGEYPGITILARVMIALQQGVCKECRRPCVGGYKPDGCGCRGSHGHCEWDRATTEEQARAAIAALRIKNPIYYVSGLPNASPQDLDWNKRIDAILAEVATK